MSVISNKRLFSTQILETNRDGNPFPAFTNAKKENFVIGNLQAQGSNIFLRIENSLKCFE